MELRKKIFFYLSTFIFYIWSALAVDNNKLYGLHSDELNSGQLIIPRKVNQYGEFLTYNLTHNHDQHYQYEQHRRRSHTNNGLNNNLEDLVHYHFDIDNETLHLELEPHSYFMAPHLVIERHRRDLRTRKKSIKNTNCHFHGKVRGHTETRVAISTCEGLVGHIKTKNNEYYIEPSKHHDAHLTNGHPHVVFHRSSVKEKQRQHNKTKRKNRKRKLHQQQQHPKLQHHSQQQQQQQQQLYQPPMSSTLTAGVSNCGTKEPRRRMETRLEWQPQGKVKIQGGRKIRRHHAHQHHNNNKKHQRHQHQPQTKFLYQTTEDAANTPSTISPVSATAAASVSLAAIASTATVKSSHKPHAYEFNKDRTKRSISSPRHVETLIVADATMVAFHSKSVETYLLTIMNMVSALYKDPSIGNSIEVVVVKIILLEEDEAAHPDLNLTQNAQKNLDTFCSWQHHLNTANEKDPHHHDVAILITRKNICGNNCMTLGLANVGGMCKPKQSCSVNEDNGIMLSHTIAHELGHNFGMFHDTAKIGCHPRVGSIVHIMTPTFGADTLQVCWSNCSRKYITHFLDQGLGECLDDAPTPHDQYIYPESLPGVTYNAEIQCRLQFNVTDSDVGACSSMNEICSTLWCKVNGECVTNMRPTAPGTSCGDQMWCQNGKCVNKIDITPIDGGWGNWSEWSVCSRSCGGGVSIQQRECNNPVPANGGLFCIGERKRYKICRKNTCPDGEPNFRAKQCSNYDNVPYQGGGTYKWLPFFDKKNPCKLVCTDEDDTIIANWGDVVLDGTPCTLGTNNMCIDGICKKVGCDWNVDSDLQDDRCGICGGNGTQCKPVKEFFTETFNVTDGYVEIVTIPAKARHIIIKELSNSQNFLAIARANSSHFYLNGDSLISMPGEFIIAGAESLYDRIDEQEFINIPQPIEHSIALYVIVRSSEPNEGIYYEFTLPVVNVSNSKHYLWKLKDWGPCSVTCGGGLQHRELLCYENGNLTLKHEKCWSHAQNKRPKRLSRTCNDIQCPAHWWVGPWQFCPVTCKSIGKSEFPVKRRSVMCLDQHEIVVDDIKCNAATRPAETEPCQQHLPDCEEVEKLNSKNNNKNNNNAIKNL